MIEKIFQKYGQAFALINTVELHLKTLLDIKGGLNQIDQELRDKLIEKNTLERNFNLAKHLIKDKKLQKKIGKLIDSRTHLAHQPLIILRNRNRETGYALLKKSKLTNIDEKFFHEIVLNAADIYNDLVNLIKQKSDNTSANNE